MYEAAVYIICRHLTIHLVRKSQDMHLVRSGFPSRPSFSTVKDMAKDYLYAPGRDYGSARKKVSPCTFFGILVHHFPSVL